MSVQQNQCEVVIKTDLCCQGAEGGLWPAVVLAGGEGRHRVPHSSEHGARKQSWQVYGSASWPVQRVQETGIKIIPKKKKCKKAKWLSEEALQIAVKRREAKGKGEKERY